uniref:hypothetical protein n=1 Tax=Scytonema sp. HK-05 TaxID=1137095 RepID=UPI0013010255
MRKAHAKGERQLPAEGNPPAALVSPQARRGQKIRVLKRARIPVNKLTYLCTSTLDIREYGSVKDNCRLGRAIALPNKAVIMLGFVPQTPVACCRESRHSRWLPNLRMPCCF